MAIFPGLSLKPVKFSQLEFPQRIVLRENITIDALLKC